MQLISQFLNQITPKVKQTINTFFDQKISLANSISPRLQNSLSVLKETATRGGKYLRPMLVVAAYGLSLPLSKYRIKSHAEQETPVYQVAAAVEVFHRYLLHLDDMCDGDELRHGGPSLWKYYEQKAAGYPKPTQLGRSLAEIDTVLLGSLAYELVLKADLIESQKLQILNIFNDRMHQRTAAGWQEHYYQNLESLPEAQPQTYLRGLNLVSAEYTVMSPLLVGLNLSQQQPSWQKWLALYANQVGLGFQLQDDVLGLYGDPEVTGKPVGGDLREGKKTLLMLEAYSRASDNQKKYLAAKCGHEITEAELNEVRQIVDQTGALAHVKELAKRAAHKGMIALQHLPKVYQQRDEFKVLNQLAEYVVDRQS